MFDSVINYMDKFGPELLVIQFGFLIILSTLFLWLWFSNRRKYHNLKHAIPANVVKTYLDSIIQNSTALKSSLFRGGGMDLGSEAMVPSVMPLTSLTGGEGLALNGAPSTALLEEINAKKALIASLEAQLSSAQNSQKEIEGKFTQTKTHLTSAEAKIKELEALLAEARNADNGSGGGDASLKSEISMLTKERDEIRDRLREFEIISDDLANLKRLQQENEQLKRSLAALQGGAPAPAPAAAAPVAPIEAPLDPDNILSQADVNDLLQDLSESESQGDSDTSALEEFLSTPEEDTSEADMLAAMNEQNNAEEDNKPKSEKTSEDLLSEFEKMLG